MLEAGWRTELKSRVAYGQVKESSCWMMVLHTACRVFLTCKQRSTEPTAGTMTEWASGVLNQNMEQVAGPIELWRASAVQEREMDIQLESCALAS